MTRNTAYSYACAPCFIASGIAARLLLDPLLGQQYPYAIVFLAVLATAWSGGLRPALLSVVLGALGSDFFLIPPRGSFHLGAAAEQAGMGLYLITGFGISLLAGSMHGSRERAESNLAAAKRAEADLRALGGVLEERVAERTAALREQALILDLAHDAIFIRDDQDRVVYWNQGAQRLYGWSLEEAMDRITHELLRTRFPEPLEAIRARLATHGSWNGELVHTRRDGSLMTVASNWTLHRGTPGRPASVIELNFDISERKTVERELEKSTARLEAIFRGSPDGIVVFEAIRDEAGVLRDLRFAMVNPAAERLTRVSASGLIGVHFTQKLPAAPPDGFLEKYARVIADGTDVEFEHFYENGELRKWFRVTAVKLADGLVVTFSDVTSRRLAEEKRQAVATRLGLAAGILHAGVWEWDVAGNLVEWDDNMRRIYGIAADEAVTCATWSNAVVPDDLPRAQALHREVIAQKSQASMEYRIRLQDGSLRYIQSSCGAIPGDTGDVARVVGVNIDVTESRKVEELFHLVVDAAPNAMIAVGADGRIALVNSQTEKLFGYPRGELLGQPLDALIPERFRSQHCGHVGAFLAAPATRAANRRQKLFGLRRDGSEVPLEIGLNPVSTADGLFVLASIVDISERSATKERARLLAALIDGAKDYGIFMLNPEGCVLTWNPGAARVQGYAEEEIVGKHFSVFYTPEAVEAGLPERELRIARATGKFEDEGWRVRRGGSRFWATVLVTAVYDDDGTLRGFSKLTRDTTERKRTEERFQRVVEASPSAMIMVGADGMIRLVNHQTEKLFGYCRQELLGMPLEMLVPERFRSVHGDDRQGFFAAPSNRAMGAGRDLFGLRKDGSEVPVEIGLSPIASSEGPFVLASVIDITWRKHVVSELQARAAEMERFTYTVSHDLKSPLITIRSYISMIDRDLAAGNFERARPDLQRVARATDKMHGLLEEVLKLSRVGRLEMTPERVSFGSLAREALELVGGRINEKHIRVEIAPDLPFVTVDRNRMIEVLQNLLDNAAKFIGGQAEPEIWIGADGAGDATGLAGGRTRFFVKDNGCGVEPKYHEKIFGLFDKLDAKSEGSGAGLAIVRRIIEMHGGRIWVESKGKGSGSTFWFTLNDGQATQAVQPEKQVPRMATSVV